MGDLPRDGDDWAEGEAGLRYPLKPTGAEEKASAIATTSMMLTLLDDAQLWFDFEGVKGDLLAMGTDFGVVGVECSALDKDLECSHKFEVRENKRLGRKKEPRPFGLN
jgi:hypothetical protein